MSDTTKPALSAAVKLLGQAVEAADDAPLDLAALRAYQRGELPPEERRAVEERLAWSRADARLLRDWQEFSQREAPAMEESEIDAAWRRLEGRLAEPPAAGLPPPSPREVARQSVPAALSAPSAPVGSARRTPGRRAAAWRPWAAAAALAFAVTAGGWGVWQERRAASLERQLAAPATGWAPVALHLESDPLRAVGAPAARLDFPPGARRRVIYLHPSRDLPGGQATLRLLDARGAVQRTLADVPAVDGALSFALSRGELAPGRYTIEVLAAGGGTPAERFALEVEPAVDR